MVKLFHHDSFIASSFGRGMGVHLISISCTTLFLQLNFLHPLRDSMQIILLKLKYIDLLLNFMGVLL